MKEKKLLYCPNFLIFRLKLIHNGDLWHFRSISIIFRTLHILSTAVAFFCVIADNDFLNDPHNLIYSWILLIMISLYVPVP